MFLISSLCCSSVSNPQASWLGSRCCGRGRPNVLRMAYIHVQRQEMEISVPSGSYCFMADSWDDSCVPYCPRYVHMLSDQSPSPAYDVWIFTDDSLAALGAEKMVAFETSIRATSAFVDVMIASLMTFLLVNTGRSSFARSNKMIFRLVAVTINSGIWTAVVAIIDLSLIAAFPHGLQFCAFEFPLSSLYVNTLLANLNARQYLRGKDAGWNVSSTTPQTGTSNIDLRPIGTARSAYTKNETSMNEASMAIRVDTSKVMDTDTYIDVNSSKGHDLA
ncbi:hypothetical protein AcW1_003223 [Taiwanofungus camphoratus]|nr:hypothetical protein AcW1_003223 [Antrodia cinnamomea]